MKIQVIKPIQQCLQLVTPIYQAPKWLRTRWRWMKAQLDEFILSPLLLVQDNQQNIDGVEDVNGQHPTPAITKYTWHLSVLWPHFHETFQWRVIKSSIKILQESKSENEFRAGGCIRSKDILQTSLSSPSCLSIWLLPDLLILAIEYTIMSELTGPSSVSAHWNEEALFWNISISKMNTCDKSSSHHHPSCLGLAAGLVASAAPDMAHHATISHGRSAAGAFTGHFGRHHRPAVVSHTVHAYVVHVPHHTVNSTSKTGTK